MRTRAEESAGGGSVHAMVSAPVPLTADLFNKAVATSHGHRGRLHFIDLCHRCLQDRPTSRTQSAGLTFVACRCLIWPLERRFTTMKEQVTSCSRRSTGTQLRPMATAALRRCCRSLPLHGVRITTAMPSTWVRHHQRREFPLRLTLTPFGGSARSPLLHRNR